MPPPEAAKPTNWSEAEVRTLCAEAREEFRQRRLAAPKAEYKAAFGKIDVAVREVIAALPQLLSDSPPIELLANFCADEHRFAALRYLAAPPISVDDLETLLDARVNPSALRANPALARDMLNLLRSSIDEHRFPWLVGSGKASPSRREAARLATSVAATIQRVQTQRRGDEKEELEGAVRATLIKNLGYKELARLSQPIRPENFRDLAPRPGEFMRDATLGEDNGDFVIGLPDQRLLALECKSSNSHINSRKRLNKEAAKNARGWVGAFGRLVIPGAVLRGVFKPEYVLDAQATPLALFWSHRPGDLEEFIRRAA